MTAPQRGPGRPPLSPDGSERLTLRLPSPLVALAREAAAREGVAWAVWLRQAIVARVMETVGGLPAGED